MIQLAIDKPLSAKENSELASRLRPLRDEGVLILGSGSVVHNLHTYAWSRRSVGSYAWAIRFESSLRQRIEARAIQSVEVYETLGPDAALAVPTPDHYLPLIYVLAQHQQGEPITFPVEGFDGGSVSVLGFRVG